MARKGELKEEIYLKAVCHGSDSTENKIWEQVACNCWPFPLEKEKRSQYAYVCTCGQACVCMCGPIQACARAHICMHTHHPHQVRNVPDFTEPWWTFLWPQNTEGSEGTLDKAGWIPKPASPPFSLISGPTLHGYFLLLAFPRGTIWRLIERHVGKEADAERNTPHRRQMKIIHQKRKTIKQVMLSACLALHKTGLELPAPSSVAGAH